MTAPRHITIDFGTIQGDARALLRAYDIPLDGLAESLLANAPSLTGDTEDRLEHLEAILAEHAPGGSDYYALREDAATLDDALIPWRQLLEGVLAQEQLDPYSTVFVVKHLYPDAIMFLAQPMEGA